MDQSSIKSIVAGRSNFDSDFCASIPLNFINLVQDHGVLMVLSRTTLNIIQISENCNQILNIPYNEILNTALSNFIPRTQFDDIFGKINQLGTQDQLPFSLTFNSPNESGLSLTSTIHIKEDYIILELERERPIEGNITFTYLHQQLKFIMAKLKDAGNIETLSQTAASEIRALSKFDRVMVYKFDEDWNGIVIGEDKAEDMEPYLHLRFPASDIPKPARDLYLKNPYRLIPDRTAKSSRLSPVVNPITQSFTDLSECNLRSVPGVHLEYLKNMNVMASMSTPIIKDNKLWGLISCHHKTAKYLSYEMLSGFELLSGIIAAQLTAQESQTLLISKNNLIEMNGKLLAKLYTDESLLNTIFNSTPNILSLLRLNGAAFLYQGDVTTVGTTPDKHQINELGNWLQKKNIDKIFYSDNISKIYKEGEAFSQIGSGIIILPIDTYKGNYIIGFRPESIVNLQWGGNPYEAVNLEADGKTYHPRNSFAQWKETVKHTSDPWLKEEIEAAEVLRTSILQKMIRKSD